MDKKYNWGFLVTSKNKKGYFSPNKKGYFPLNKYYCKGG
jgi:hypothetical protein